MADRIRAIGARTIARLAVVGALAGAVLLASGFRNSGSTTATGPRATVARPAAAPASEPPVLQSIAMPLPSTADQRFVVKRILDLKGPLRHGDFAWDEKGVPDGPIVITVDLAAEVLSVFRGGYEIGTAAILYGAPDMPSPLGTFPIIEKDADHVSNLYDAPMPYMLRLTNDGVAIHGSNVVRDLATHGCIGVPTEFAALLFKQARLGDRVIITRGQALEMGQQILPS